MQTMILAASAYPSFHRAEYPLAEQSSLLRLEVVLHAKRERLLNLSPGKLQNRLGTHDAYHYMRPVIGGWHKSSL